MADGARLAQPLDIRRNLTRMDAHSWALVRELFHSAVALPADERSAFLYEATGGDARLISEVEDLLRHDEIAESILDARMSQIANSGVNALPDVPERIGPYRLIREIGRGGMSVVYLAERDDLENRVALKILATGPLSPYGAERFMAEERVLARLDHPAIARILDAGILPGGAPFFAMEYIDGVPISDFVATRELSLRTLLPPFLEVCEAVDHAHRQAVIHRDLKPSNILVTVDGRVKLLDFGIAKRLDIDMPADGTIPMLTPAYASPEQLSGRPVDVQTDVFALGVILYELLTGELPADPRGLSPGDFEHLRERVPKAPSRRLRVTGVTRGERADIDSLCLRALDTDPARRYLSVEALRRDIRRFLEDRPLEARTPLWQYRAGKFVRRQRMPLLAGIIVAGMLLGTSTYYSLNLAGARDEALSEAERVQRIQHFMLGLFAHDTAGAGPADTLRLMTVLDHGANEAHLLDGDPAIQAELFSTLGGIFMQRGNLNRADSLLRASADLHRSRLPGSAAGLARSLIALGNLRIEQSRLEEADVLIEEGLTIVRTHHPSGHPDLAEALIALGSVHQARGDYDRAASSFEAAAEMLSRLRHDGVALTDALGRLASSHFYAGRYPKSDSLNRLVLAIEERTYGRQHPTVAGTLVNLAATRFQLGYYQEAELLYRRALEIYLGYYGREHHLTASNMSMLAQTLVAENRLEEAMDLLKPALEVRERVLGPMHPRVASTLNELGTIAVERSDFDGAESYFQRMLEIYLHTYADDHFLIGIAHSNLATVHFGRHEFDRAEEAMRTAIRVMTSTLSSEHMQTAVAHVKLGRVLMSAGRLDDAEDEVRLGISILETQISPEAGWMEYATSTLATIQQSRNDLAGAPLIAEQEGDGPARPAPE